MTAASPDLRSSAWAGLLQEHQAAAPARPAGALARAREQCRSARADMRAALASVEGARPAPTWLREWVSCLDELLELTERLHAHVEALPRSRTPTPV